MNSEQVKQLLSQFIRKCNPLAFRNEFGVCEFCGCAREFPDPMDMNIWKPRHHASCLFAQAEKAIDDK